jgi:melibiose permease/lactose/raffinose/galactose permease
MKEIRPSNHNRVTFGIGTIGRDMVYSLVSMYLIYYLTDIIKLPTSTLWWVAGIILAARIFDALNDPVMGIIVDHTRSRWGKFKPWIAVGVLLTSVFTLLMFSDFGLEGGAYIIVFGLIYILWGISYTMNDISYYSMLPVLSVDQKEREKIGAVARICANIGLFFVVAGIVPLTELLGNRFGGSQKGYFVFAAIVTAVMLAGQCVTLFGVKQTALFADKKAEGSGKKESAPLREMVRVIFKNDQLLFTAIAMALFMIGYTTTASFGLYFFKYAYGDEGMYPIFAMILGLSQITALAIFPLLRKRFERDGIFKTAIILIVAGYVLFFFAPVNTLVFIGIAGILIFTGQSFVQVLMLMFLADSVDYGHWKLGKRNDSISFSLQPFINKMGGAISSGVVSAVVILSGIKDAETAADVTAGGLFMMKVAMLVFPLICIVACFFIYRKKYRIDAKFHAQIISDLAERGEMISSTRD